MTINGYCSYPKVKILRVFPLSYPNNYYSVLDGNNNEIGIIMDIESLSPENIKLIEEHLTRRYIVPEIKRILSAKEKFGFVEWVLETDRGMNQIITKNLSENIDYYKRTNIIIFDNQGNRFSIKDIDKLNRKSKKLLLQHL